MFLRMDGLFGVREVLVYDQVQSDEPGVESVDVCRLSMLFSAATEEELNHGR
jgi:hypothetical protein